MFLLKALKLITLSWQLAFLIFLSGWALTGMDSSVVSSLGVGLVLGGMGLLAASVVKHFDSEG